MLSLTDTAARAALVDRAEGVRTALLCVHETGAVARSGSSTSVLAWHRAQASAQPSIRAYRAALGELNRRDRVGRRVGAEWLEVAVTAFWYRVAEAREAEELAHEHLRRLPVRTCPRTAGGEIARAHQFAIAVWIAEHKAANPMSATTS
jgi:hypothetical protein